MKYFSFLLLIAILAGSCNIIGNRIKGNGKISSQTYDLGKFESIGVSNAIHLILKQDSAFSVKAETDENLLSRLDISVHGNVLHIGTKKGWLNPTDEIKVFVSMPLVKNIEISGASNITSETKFSQDQKMSFDLNGASEGTIEVRAPIVDMTASGASTLNISGESRDVKARASGASSINASDLKSENCEAKASGASTAHIFASIALNANASGASKITYQGNPAVKQEASGASEVKKAD